MGRLTEWLYGAAVTAPPPGAVSAAAGAVALAHDNRGNAFPGWGVGPPLEPFTTPDIAPPWWDRDAAMSLPTVQRCRDLICATASALPLSSWRVDRTVPEPVWTRLPDAAWFDRPDPNKSRQWILAWTVDDLFFHGVAHWEITGRAATTFPSRFRRIRPGTLQDNAGVWTITDDNGRPREISPRDVVEFLSPFEGLLTNGYRAISIALQLDAAAERFAGTEVPAGVLEEQDGAEDMSSDELAELALSFSIARHQNTTAATNKYVRYREIPYDASSMQLVEGRTHQALELARLGNVPPYLVGAPAGTGMTYLNGQQARADLLDFGAAPFLVCVEQTLSGPNVTPRGQEVHLERDVWLARDDDDADDVPEARVP